MDYSTWKQTPRKAKIVGIADDEQNGIQALTVVIDGQTERPKFNYIDSKGKEKPMGQGGFYHITLSKNPEVPAKKSNDILGSARPLGTPIEIDLTPEYK